MDPFVAHHLLGVSRTYAILVPMLPEPLADAVGVAYLLMRIVDTIEDAPELAVPDRLRSFDLLERASAGDRPSAAALAGPVGATADERALMSVIPEVLARVHALTPERQAAVCGCARQMIAGVRRLIVRSAERSRPYPAITSIAELREYCYYVAGVVGEMLCAMMAGWLNQPALERQKDVAVELGIGLQLVNILKDALADADQGRRYLPVASGAAGVNALVYRAVLAEARRSLRRGIDFVLALPAEARALRTFCGLPIAWGGLTLARAERDAAEAKIGRAAVRDTTEAFSRVVSDDRALRAWLEALVGESTGPDSVGPSGG